MSESVGAVISRWNAVIFQHGSQVSAGVSGCLTLGAEEQAAS